MKVVFNNCDSIDNKPIIIPITVECEHCGSVLEITEDDLDYGEYGCGRVKCPCCNKYTYEGIDKHIELTKDNLSFPKHYADFKGGVPISDNVINGWVKESISWLEEHPHDGIYKLVGSGDTVVYITIDDDEYCIHVCRGYYEGRIKRLEEE